MELSTNNSADIDALIVEPSLVQASVVARALEKLGVISIRTVKNGADALAAMRSQTPTVVISAMYLPDMSGTELVQSMRHDLDLERVAFVLVSSETRPQLLEGIRQSGVCGILPKPFELPQLKIALDATLQLLGNEDASQSPLDGDHIRVLLVDDSLTARKFMRHVLERLGLANIIEAVSGREAAALLENTMVDLIVTDYNMPEMDGRELTEFVRRNSWQNSVPILMVTSERNETRLAAVQEAGVSGVCDKPFEPDLVRGLLQRMLAERAA